MKFQEYLSGKTIINEEEYSNINTAEGKAEYIKKYISVKEKDILNKTKQMPKEWTGSELRQYILDKFTESTERMNAREKKEYDNQLATTTL